MLNKPMVIETSKCKELTRLTDGWMPKQAGQGGPLMQASFENQPASVHNNILVGFILNRSSRNTTL